MTANSDVDTEVSGAGANAGVAASNTAATGAGAAEHRTSGSDAHTVHAADFDGNAVRSIDVDKDTGTDERYEVETADRSTMGWLNAKRTYDWHQTLDSDNLLNQRLDLQRDRDYTRRRENTEFERRMAHQAKMDSLEVAEREQRIAHANAEAEQRRRHYEDMHTMRFNTGSGFWSDAVQEAFAERVAGKVCAKMKAG